MLSKASSETTPLSEKIINTETDLIAAIHLAKKHNPRQEVFYYQQELHELPQFDQSQDYHAEFWRTYLLVHLQVAQLKQLNAHTSKLREKLADVQELDERLEELMKMKTKKKNRRPAKDVPKDHPCPYENCFKSYGGEVSLNLHIKNNHNGGTKTERQRIEVEIRLMQRQIRLAKLRGQPLPQITINLPPGFMERVMNSEEGSASQQQAQQPPQAREEDPVRASSIQYE